MNQRDAYLSQIQEAREDLKRLEKSGEQQRETHDSEWERQRDLLGAKIEELQLMLTKCDADTGAGPMK